MENKKTVFDFLGQVLITFGITMIILASLCWVTGEAVRHEGVSSMFRLGSAGIPLNTIAQFFTASFLITGMQYIIRSEWLTKRLPVFVRILCMVFGAIVIVVVFTLIFDWFPVNMWQAWAGFLICFGVCFMASVLLMRLKLKLEDRKLEEGLSRLKKDWQEEQ